MQQKYDSKIAISHNPMVIKDTIPIYYVRHAGDHGQTVEVPWHGPTDKEAANEIDNKRPVQKLRTHMMAASDARARCPK